MYVDINIRKYINVPEVLIFHSLSQDDLSLKEDHLIDIVTNKPLPRGFYVSGSPTVVPGLPNKLAFGESRVINYLLLIVPRPTITL